MERINCPLCGSKKKSFFELYNRWPNLIVYICKDCSFVYTYQVPDKDRIFDAQKEFRYISADGIKKKEDLSSILLRYKKQKGRRYKQIISEIKLIENKFNLKYKNILDVGCSVGAFLDYIHYFRKDIEVFGIDLYENICEFNLTRGYNVYCGNVEKMKGFKNIRFDIISYLEVLEHIVDPCNEIKIVKSILNNYGLFICEVPNLFYSYIKGKIEKNKLFRIIFKMEEWGLMPHVHYNHFSPKVIKNFFQEMGFYVIKIIPASYIRNLINTPRFIYFIYKFYSIIAFLLFKLTGFIISCNFIVFAIKKGE